MAKDDSNEAKEVVGGMGIGAAITGFVLWLRSRVQGSPGQELVIPAELAQLIASTAAAIERIDKNIASLSVQVQGWPLNTRTIRSYTLLCAVANQAYQAPQMAIPSGMQLLIKASPLNAAAALILVATSGPECLNVNSSWPLILNEPVAFSIENAQSIFVSTNVAGSQVIFSAEERKD